MKMKNDQCFLQIISHRGILSYQDMVEVCYKAYDNNEIDRHINRANRSLDNLGMMIKSVTCEQSGKTYYVFTGTDATGFENYEDDAAEFSQVQRELLNKIFELIITTGCGVSSNHCINLVGQIKGKLNHTQASDFIKTLAARQWLSLIDGEIFIGVRSIAELMPLFKSKFRDSLASCGLCKQTVFHNQKCNQCGVKFHLYCVKNYAQAMSKGLKCPECNQVMDVEEPYQPMAIDDDDDDDYDDE